MDRINLDHNATTPILPEAADAMRECWTHCGGNPASPHAAGRHARRMLEEAREGLGEILGARLTGRRPDRLIFTSGGTEANNLALFGLGDGRRRHVGVSAIEHPSITHAADHLERIGCPVDRLAVDAEGVVCVEAVDESLRGDTRLLSVMLANNETGVVQPVAELAARAAAAGVPMHTDAVQTAGKLPIDFSALGAAAMTVSAHKFHGPIGVGALLLRGDATLAPQLFGGYQQEALRPGTESVALAVGMHTALRAWRCDAAESAARMATLRQRFESLIAAGYADAVIAGERAERLPHTSNIAFPPLDRQALLMAFDLEGVECSTGSACSSGSTEPSPTLVAMGCPEAVVGGALRFSLGRFTTDAEVDEAARRILAVCNELRAGSGGPKMPVGRRGTGAQPL